MSIAQERVSSPQVQEKVVDSVQAVVLAEVAIVLLMVLTLAALPLSSAAPVQVRGEAWTQQVRRCHSLGG